MAKFAYNNAKNASFNFIQFELNCNYYAQMSYKKNVDFYSKSKSANKLLAEPKELMIVCRKNLHHAQNFEKRAYNKNIKPKSYALGNKAWLNSKYIKTKQNQRLEAKLFAFFEFYH